MLHENDVVKLKRNIPPHSPAAWRGMPSVDLAVGDVGTIVAVYTSDLICYEYEVEFVDDDGVTRDLLQLKEEDIELV